MGEELLGGNGDASTAETLTVPSGTSGGPTGAVQTTRRHTDDIDAAKEKLKTTVTVAGQTCSNPLCPNKSRKPDLKSCGRCLRAKYCSPECQRGHWKDHKKSCTRIDRNDIDWTVEATWAMGVDLWILLRSTMAVVKALNEKYVRETTFTELPDGALLLDYRTPNEMYRDVQFLKKHGVMTPSGWSESERMPARVYQMRRSAEVDEWLERLVERARVINHAEVLDGGAQTEDMIEWVEKAKEQRMAHPEEQTAYPMGVAWVGERLMNGLVWIQHYRLDSWIHDETER